MNICSDALDVDYSQFSYDFVFCSPPFYNTEVYEHMPYSELTKEQYDTDFYEPLFLQVFSGLQRSGHMCLHTPERVARRIEGLIGPPSEVIELPPLKQRFADQKPHKEYIYVWHAEA